MKEAIKDMSDYNVDDKTIERQNRIVSRISMHSFHNAKKILNKSGNQSREKITSVLLRQKL